MICKECAFEADNPELRKLPARQARGHSQCKGCDCQHKPIKNGQIKND